MTDEPIENPEDTAPIDGAPQAESDLVETRTDAKLPKVSGLRGRKLGGYTLLKELGHGGQGYVYLAEDERLHRRVALKILPLAMSFSEAARLRFEREAEVASKLDHPGICTVYETGEEDGIPFIAMQLIEGEALDRKIKSSRAAAAEDRTVSHIRFESSDVAGSDGATSSPSRPTPRSRAEIMEVVRFIENVARAMHAAHETGLIHRDIKPGNIMAAADGRAVILDFGLARDETAHLATLTQSGDLMGTPAYMAPEQVAANRIKLDRRADVYSLGVTLYECLTLQRPFERPTRESLYNAILTQAPPDLRQLNPAIPKSLRVVIETALRKDREKRYQTALDFAEDLRNVAENRPINSRAPRIDERLILWLHRHPSERRIILASGLLCALLSVGVLTFLATVAKNFREHRHQVLTLQLPLYEHVIRAAVDPTKSDSRPDIGAIESELRDVFIHGQENALVSDVRVFNDPEIFSPDAEIRFDGRGFEISLSIDEVDISVLGEIDGISLFKSKKYVLLALRAVKWLFIVGATAHLLGRLLGGLMSSLRRPKQDS